MLLAAEILLFLFLLWMFLIAPNVIKPKRDVGGLTKTPYAHRGLFDNLLIPENSLPAFERAVKRDYGIELDVHLTKDGRLIVFHDDTLMRMCGVEGRPEEKTLSELQALKLLHGEEKIPAFDDVLTMVNGQVPLLIEMKGSAADVAVAKALDERMRRYEGRYMVESFNPLHIFWYRRHAPDVMRGQLSGKMEVKAGAAFKVRALMFLLRNLLLNVLSRPDFIAYEGEAERNLVCRLQRTFFSPLWAVWTVKTPKEFEIYKKRYAILIFEGFDPKESGLN